MTPTQELQLNGGVYHKYTCETDHEDAETFALIDYLISAPTPTPEEIVELTGIRLSDFDYEIAGHQFRMSPEEFVHHFINEAMDSKHSGFGNLEDHWIRKIRKGEQLIPEANRWSFIELFTLFHYLKDLFEPSYLGFIKDHIREQLPVVFAEDPIREQLSRVFAEARRAKFRLIAETTTD